MGFLEIFIADIALLLVRKRCFSWLFKREYSFIQLKFKLTVAYFNLVRVPQQVCLGICCVMPLLLIIHMEELTARVHAACTICRSILFLLLSWCFA